MSAISPALLHTIRELQSFESFDGSALGGGTNLAIRHQHRISTDIDIFFPHIIGKTGYERIKEEIQKFYGGRVFGLQFPCAIDDQYIFLRFFVICDGETIKVEVLQNMRMLDDIEDIDGIRFVSELDIALFKMLSATNRATQKDIYDLDLLSERIPLIQLFEQLERKRSLFSGEECRTIFDLDEETNPLDAPLTLLKFDNGDIQAHKSRPHHSQNRVDIAENQKSWPVARSSWRKKVRVLFDQLNITFPSPSSSDVEYE
ncbi:Nucleotidyl transferase AbiEii toxin, Type IV TA system [Sphingobacterium nematocida]|uniref:Nucleotidyl transferase AbiEii toxin, Type IV TA system n=1 Tax=Sphingobacterium nematocida TaxID=1513896 RepID=A0A1T5EF59_9SPHI|nr:nucleotidyl transferase AbiEii/AbiGii toxin family protein [Sphingobacterium nematocida]SKB82448.1 Nucleotidyl transferase AbiEii toxin, Type IV TA system [Sphingobacterium nematocida]